MLTRLCCKVQPKANHLHPGSGGGGRYRDQLQACIRDPVPPSPSTSLCSACLHTALVSPPENRRRRKRREGREKISTSLHHGQYPRPWPGPSTTLHLPSPLPPICPDPSPGPSGKHSSAPPWLNWKSGLPLRTRNVASGVLPGGSFSS